MAKNKPKGGSASKTSSIRELIREHHSEDNNLGNTAENTVAEAVTPIQGVSMASQPTAATTPPEKTAPTVSRPQFYNQVTAHILGDCAVQPDASGIYDVMARNFGDSGMLSWWLHRIGHADMTKLGRRKDLFDYLRLVSNALHRELKRDLGRPVARL